MVTDWNFLFKLGEICLQSDDDKNQSFVNTLDHQDENNLTSKDDLENQDNLRNIKDDLHIAGYYTALDMLRFVGFFDI